MEDLLPPGPKHFTRTMPDGRQHQFSQDRLNWKAKVVCGTCNSTWMSDIEAQHAKPSMSDLISGKLDIPILPPRAAAMALFAFKSAVVVDHMARNRTPFFSRSIRHAFASTLSIPANVSMWLAGFLPMGTGSINAFYHSGKVEGHSLELYTCTYAIGRLVLQIVAANHGRKVSLRPKAGYEFPSVPFWPGLVEGFVWPAPDVLRTSNGLLGFAERWGDIRVFS